MDGWMDGIESRKRRRWTGRRGVLGRGLGWEIPLCRPQHRLGVRLGPEAIVVNPYPPGPRTQFPASLIENDGLFLVGVNKTRSLLWGKKHFVWFCSWSSSNLIMPLLLHFKMCYHLCLDCLPASGEINTHAALLCWRQGCFSLNHLKSYQPLWK